MKHPSPMNDHMRLDAPEPEDHQPHDGDCRASACSADFDAEKKAIEFQELFFPEAGKQVRTAVRFSFAQGFRMAQKQNAQAMAPDGDKNVQGLPPAESNQTGLDT